MKLKRIIFSFWSLRKYLAYLSGSVGEREYTVKDRGIKGIMRVLYFLLIQKKNQIIFFVVVFSHCKTQTLKQNHIFYKHKK